MSHESWADLGSIYEMIFLFWELIVMILVVSYRAR